MHDSIAAQVLALCRERGLTLSAAESITGGLIAKCITDVPGASQVFLGAVVSYTNEVKNHVLGVPSSLLEAYGAVSEPVARAMAMGVRVLTGSDLAVAVTGLAGPDGDDRGNPVGTVFIGLATPDATFCRAMQLGKRRRDLVRHNACNHAFDALRRYLTGLDPEKL